MSHIQIRSFIFAALTVWCTGYTAILQADVSLSNTPLFITSNADPNIMLLLDTSGSMHNVVPEVPFVATTIYLASCPSSNQVPATSAVDLNIVAASGSLPQQRIRYGGTNYIWGTTTGLKCFVNTTNYKARLNAVDNTSLPYAPGTYLGAQYTGNYLNWYFNSANTTPTWTTARKKPGTQSRFEIAKTASNTLISTLNNSRVGLASYNVGTAGTIQEIVKDIDVAANRTSIQARIDALTAAGSTPLAETLQDIGRYFVQGANNTLTLHPGKTNQSTASAYTLFDHVPQYNSAIATSSRVSPIQAFCQKNFAVVLTDGRPQEDRGISAASGLRDYTGDCAAGKCIATANTTDIPNVVLTNTNYENGTKIGRRYESQGSDYLDDVAAALFDIDLRPDLDDADGKEVKNNILTYTIGFADDEVRTDPLMQSTADHGGGTFETAADANELAESLSAIFKDIKEQSGSAASVAASSGFVSTDTSIFQALFNSDGWTGQLLSLPIDENGVIDAENWDAADEIPAHAARSIFTIDPVAAVGSRGMEFKTLGNLTASQRAALNTSAAGALDTNGQLRLNYLRGDDVNEGVNGSSFRDRTTLLGDIINSAPEYVGAPAFRYPDTWEANARENSSPYSAFVTANKSRTPIVYAGANDGMLHAFNATNSGGQELFAYIPNAVFPNLSKLAGLTYDSDHQYYVDGSPSAGDAFFGGAWHTVLVGGLNKGGKAIYALDVTDPTSFDAGDVKWEFTDANDLGFTYSQPVVVRMNNGKWVAVFGNGYNSANQDAVLFVVDIDTGTVISKLGTGTTGAGDSTAPNGLATPAAVDKNGDRIVDYIYAGDLKGNMWKFDVSSNNAANWALAFGGVPLFTATDTASNPQPITSRPQVGSRSNGGQTVLFGTGKYLGSDDITNLSVQTFYGIVDDGTSPVAGKNQLLQQAVSGKPVSFNGITIDVRTSTDNQLTNQKGWYMNLPIPGERQVSNSVLRDGRIIFTTVAPSNVLCGLGGTSWLMQLNAFDGSRLSFTPFDLNGDGIFNDKDYVPLDLDGNGFIEEGEKGAASGKGSDNISSGPIVLGAKGKDLIIDAGSDGVIGSEKSNSGDTTLRQSWRQLQ